MLKSRCIAEVTYAEQRIGAKITPRRVKLLSKILPHLSRRLQPITRLLKKDVPFSFDAEMEAIVREILKVLTKPPVLVYPDFEAARHGSRKFRLYCDASAAGFGAMLEQPQKTTRCGR